METMSSCSIINGFPSLTTPITNTNSNNRFCLKTPRNHTFQLSPLSYTFSGKSHFPDKYFTAFCSPSSPEPETHSPELAVLLEVEGVLIDAYRLGNRQAFNTAFQKLGLDCANWTEPIYSDLLRKNAGEEERMLIMYFNRIGWPTSLPTSEKGSFIKSVLREKNNALNEFMMSSSLPLRPGVGDFIDDAYKEGLPVVILTSYCKTGDKISSSIMDKLGQERASKVKVVGSAEVAQSLYSQLLLTGVNSGVEEQLANEARKAVASEKQRIAEEVASKLKLRVDINTTSPDSMNKIVAALRAGAENARLPVDKCILVAGSQSGVAAAELIGMPCIVMRSSLTARAEFPSAKAVMDGFGGADLTVSKLCGKRWS